MTIQKPHERQVSPKIVSEAHGRSLIIRVEYPKERNLALSSVMWLDDLGDAYDYYMRMHKEMFSKIIVPHLLRELNR